MSEDDVVVELPKIAPGKTCNARNKAHTKHCARPAGWGTDHPGVGRCKLHGGSSLKGKAHPLYKHGKYSKVLPDRLSDHYEELLSDHRLLELKDDIALISAMINEALEDLRDNFNTSAVYFRQIMRLIKDLTSVIKLCGDSIPKDVVDLVSSLNSAIKDAYGMQSKREEILRMLDEKRKLTESERRRYVEMHQIFSAEQVMAVLAGVISVIREVETDPERQERIASGIRKLIHQTRRKDMIELLDEANEKEANE